MVKAAILWLIGLRRGVTDFGTYAETPWRSVAWYVVHDNFIVRRRRRHR
jgi:hypothetical protein